MSITRSARPSGPQDVIVQELRGQIVGGSLLPGDRLPTRSDLETAFGVSCMTVQRALDRLKSDGFVQVNGRNGTSVSMAPPHLARYGLVFTYSPGSAGWNRYLEALLRSAEQVSAAGSRRVATYYCSASEPAPEGLLGFEQLRDDLKCHRLAGVIITAWPVGYELQKMLDECTVPQMLLSKSGDPVHPSLDLDHNSFWSKATGFLRDHGCKRVACISSYGAAGWRSDFEAHVAENGLVTRPHWWQLASLSAHQIALLLFHAGQHERPDGLIVSDDNYVSSALSGLLEAGLGVPGDIEVVGHCNFPVVSSAPVPVKLLGYDARAIIQGSMANIDSMRKGEVPSHTQLPAVFEDELANPANYSMGSQHNQ